MAESRLYRTEAIVLRRSDFGEADRIVTLYTPRMGKMRVIAKGVRRPTSHLGGHLELFTHSRVMLAKGRNLDLITQAETVHAFIGLRDDLWRATCACYAAELLDKLTAEGIENRPCFDLLLQTLDRVANARNPELATRFYEVQMLGTLGYRPELHHCVRCQQTLGPLRNAFSPFLGGVLCPECSKQEPSARALTTNAFKLLRLFQRGDYTTTARLRVEEPLRLELGQIIGGYAEHIVERKVRSAALLEALHSQ